MKRTADGLDQINVRLPRILAGEGEMELVAPVNGAMANTTRLSIA